MGKEKQKALEKNTEMRPERHRKTETVTVERFGDLKTPHDGHGLPDGGELQANSVRSSRRITNTETMMRGSETPLATSALHLNKTHSELKPKISTTKAQKGFVDNRKKTIEKTLNKLLTDHYLLVTEHFNSKVTKSYNCGV